MAENDEDAPTGKAKGGYARKDALPRERRVEIAKQAAEARWSQPLQLIEDVSTGDRFVLYTKTDGVDFQLRFEGEEPWATRKQMAELFGRDVSVITRHLNAILRHGELDEDSVSAKTALTAADGKTYDTKVFSLDMVLAVGYRVGSKEAMLFRRWASQILRQYLIHGFVIDAPRMKDPQRNDRLDELLEIIEDIRASEANVWKQILDLVSFCSDYHAMTPQDKSNYFATFQNAMHWAVASATAAEIKHERVDASKPYAGLTSFKGEEPTVKEGKIAKNYLGKDEITRLNMITNLSLNFLKSQAEQGRLVSVSQYTEKLREIVRLDGRPLIPAGHYGEISDEAANDKVSKEIAVYKQRIRLEKDSGVGTSLDDIIAKARQIADAKRTKRKQIAR
jgi:hypothetical protein